jgi:hypothetical protein
MGNFRFTPLPRDWKGAVKQALLHAVGLERLALAEVRAGYDRSSDPRTRLSAELLRIRLYIIGPAPAQSTSMPGSALRTGACPSNYTRDQAADHVIGRAS